MGDQILDQMLRDLLVLDSFQMPDTFDLALCVHFRDERGSQQGCGARSMPWQTLFSLRFCVFFA